MCNEFGCLWQGSTEDIEEAKRWCAEHPHGTEIITEEEKDD